MLAVSNDYFGKIVNAELQEWDDGTVSAVVICRPDGSAETARWSGGFSDKEIEKGTNKGRTWGELTAETLGSFGCTDFTKIGELIGQPVCFGVKHEQDTKDPEKIWANVNFIRPGGNRRPASAAGIASIARFRGVAMAAAAKAPKPRLVRSARSARNSKPNWPRTNASRRSCANSSRRSKNNLRLSSKIMRQSVPNSKRALPSCRRRRRRSRRRSKS